MVARIKKGDQVFVNCGKDIGKTGEVLRMLGSSAIVQGVNVVKRHQKQDQKNVIQLKAVQHLKYQIQKNMT